jgi:hypothetical protein
MGVERASGGVGGASDWPDASGVYENAPSTTIAEKPVMSSDRSTVS